MSREYVLKPFRTPTDLSVDYRADLNDQQYAAVVAPPGPALVIAGAGAGKTRTLTYRVAFLLEQGIPADRILLLTFTNKASREMMKRVSDLLQGQLSALWGGTFHSIGHRILRRHAELVGLGKDFTILDREDARALVSVVVAEMEIAKTVTRFPKSDVIVDILSSASNKDMTVAKVIENEYSEFTDWLGTIEEIGRLYLARKQKTNSVDFDDLLRLWLVLLKDHPEVRATYQSRFQFILVDEYQDTNRIQSEIIDLLAERHKNVMVVGDDSQSIYSWRGAHFLNIMDFPKRYNSATVFKIETNYRSTPEILSVANAVIAGNHNQYPKELSAVRKSGDKPFVVPCGDSRVQANFVAQRILELREEGISMREVAVLYRSHFHALDLQLELTRRNIPFSITSGIRFFEQAHIKDVAAYLKLSINCSDELSFKRLVQMIKGVGEVAASKLWNKFLETLPTLTAGAHPIARALQQIVKLVPRKATVEWAQFSTTMAQLEDCEAVPAKRIRIVMDAGYEDYLKKAFPNARTRSDDIEQLASFSHQYENVEEFLSQLALLSNLEAEHEKPTQDADEIRLTTVHQAKGLEFEIVFIIMLCDSAFPNARSMDSIEDLEEERRLFYVALTRAKDELYFVYPITRYSPSGGGDIFQVKSRFLNEIPKKLLQEMNLATAYW